MTNEVADRYASTEREATPSAPPIESSIRDAAPISSENGFPQDELSTSAFSEGSFSEGSFSEGSFSEGSFSGTAPTVVIRPTQGWLDLDLLNVWRYRELLLALATRDVKLRYRQTALGVIWVILQPLLSAGVFTIIFGKIARLNTGGVPPFLFYYAALLGWNAFSATLSKASTCIVGNAGLIAKIYFPRLILPFSVIFSTLLDFAVAFCVMLALLFAYHVPPTWGILLLPVWLGLLFLCAIGLGLIASALMVTYRDVNHILPVATSLLMYISPVIYPLSEALHRTDSRLHIFFYLNPLTGIIEAFRWSLLGSGSLLFWPLVYSVFFSCGIFLVGMIAFQRKERVFADAI